MLYITIECQARLVRYRDGWGIKNFFFHLGIFLSCFKDTTTAPNGFLSAFFSRIVSLSLDQSTRLS